MIILRKSFSAALLFIFLGFSSAHASILEELTMASESVVRIENFVQGVVKTDAKKLKLARYASSGGGFVFDGSGLIATSAHVVRGNGLVRVLFADGRYFDGKTVYREEKYDVAIVQIVPDKPLEALTLSDKDGVKLNEKVYAIGSSETMTGTISQGKVTGLGTQKNLIPGHTEPLHVMQVNFNAYTGDSGSPVFDSDGRVLGILAAALKRTGKVSYAIPSGYLKEVISKYQAGG